MPWRKKPKFSVIVDVDVGEGTVIKDHVNLYKCKIGRNCKIDAFVYIEGGVETVSYTHLTLPTKA